MPDDVMLGIIAAEGYVGWYKCPNGHVYTVGNCTWPMEEARCTQCGAIIGGSNHKPREGNRRWGSPNVVAWLKGGVA
jgi:hypothetical protein